jgi:DNA (cytosine-5)-methyltransferase 1
MRHWPGFESPGSISDHVIRSLPRDYKIFRAMQPGDQYPEAVAVAERLFKEEAKRQRLSSQSQAYKALRKQFVPPYDPGKFPNKWRKMSASEPARTLMAHLGKDSYSHIHYDGQQARTISVREAARLQSFPDGFRFVGTMNPAFKQIGNAVPPLMAYALAQTIKAALLSAVWTMPQSARKKASSELGVGGP